jgi:hypothetical protein
MTLRDGDVSSGRAQTDLSHRPDSQRAPVLFAALIVACAFYATLTRKECPSSLISAASHPKSTLSQPIETATKGYSQPASKKQVWFDAAALGGFKHTSFISGELRPSAPLHDKWIVVTTINPPTDAVKKLADLADWHVVVVGDTKTPADWAWPNVKYLSIDDQLALGFSTTQLLRTRSYQRKNIGYLYAILHGAKTIYETDDDNALTVSEVPVVPTHGFRRRLTNSPPIVGSGRGGVGRVLEYTSRGLTINHHAHFGQPSTWPRGYPLEAIGEPHVSRVQRVSVVPAVQQGLADGDPDMDAIFRLTRKPASQRIDFEFDHHAEAVALPFGSFGPYNAQNTIFTYEGLWATILPQTVEFRVCDIWRAYYTQRLLWGVGAQLVFVSPYVYQLRNAHTYYDDYLSEKQIYDQVSGFLGWLKEWSCPADDIKSSSASASALPACAYALARDMAVAGYWGPADAELVRHYFHDLTRVGYKFPQWTEKAAATGYDRFVRACEIAQGGCKSADETFIEKVTSKASISLFGTCGAAELPAAAVVNADA